MKKKVKQEILQCSLFSDISALLHEQFVEFNEIINYFAQELTSLLNLAEINRAFKQTHEELIEKAKSSLASAYDLEAEFSKAFLHADSIAKDMDSYISKAIKNIRLSLDDTKFIRMSTSEYLNSETSEFTQEITQIIHSSRWRKRVLIWEEDNHIATVQAYKRPQITVEIRFSNSITSNFSALVPELQQRCTGARMKGVPSCRDKFEHIENLFNHHSQILCNINHLHKTSLYIGLYLEKLEKYFKDLMKQGDLKFKKYYYKSIFSDKDKLEIWDIEHESNFIDRLIQIRKLIKVEYLKLESHIKYIPLQLKSSRETCIPLKYEEFSSEKDSSILQKCNNLLQFLNNIIQAIDSCTDHNYKPPSEKQEETIWKFIELFKPVVEIGLNELREATKTNYDSEVLFKKRMQSIPVYRSLHIKSQLLKRLQLHSIASNLVDSRKQLIDAMKMTIEETGLDMPHWEKSIRVLSISVLNIKAIESKVTHSYTLNHIGYHSYNSSWDLKSEKENHPNQENYVAEISDSSESENNSSFIMDLSESSLECSIHSNGEFVDQNAVSAVKSNKMLYKALKNYPSEEKIKDNKAFYYINKLNKETKEIHSKGKSSWKKEIIKLREKEDSKIRLDMIKDIYNSRTEREKKLDQYLPQVSQSSNFSLSKIQSESILDDYSERLEKAKKRRQGLNTKMLLSSLDMDRLSIVKAQNHRSELELYKKIQDESRAKSSKSIRKGTREIESVSKLLNNLEVSDKIKINRAVTSMKKFAGGNLRKRVRSVQRDKSVSPLSKINKIRQEFDLYNKRSARVNKTLASSTLCKDGDTFLVSLR
ncbi:unnamed protein product [Blepharisma stoltei]|uniref:Uncharacterized protein n=1 Tax=Blepharisma stoltei TaxID=1481888 RepID=A0AAU9KBX6_9CILI|nr:unnamed protein product [Blepharisma stoltei]